MQAAPSPLAAREVISRLVALVPPERLTGFVLDLIDHAIAPRAEANPKVSLEFAAPADAPNSALKIEAAKPAPAAKPIRARRRKRARGTGRPPGRPRKHPIGNANGKTGENVPSTGHSDITVTGNGARAEPVAMRFWRTAETIDPGRPWKAAADRFGVNLAQAQDAHRVHALPVGVSETQAAAFA